ncbi:class I SAM-dependent methyltransferase [uncultured Jannaschia sp.]|uniref:class I SAM-dependent methyltransferase n=1 Tax=uncultured Jannaschia sp. TaxID=293347 RepID=UPI00260C6AD9|nr:class I SAM-dependent methyltransferase [uncultured Jannaschia sp.]
MAGKRDETRRKMLETLPKGGTGAEVGVWEGRFSEAILEICAPVRLHLIDPWEYDPRFNNTGFGRKKNAERMPEMYEMVSARFAGDDRVVLHRATSEAALSAMADGDLDWIYIDGNHNAPFVDTDLDLASRKVRPGGVIAGDDYHWSDGEGTPVKDAVNRLVARLGTRAALETMGQQYVIRLDR